METSEIIIQSRDDLLVAFEEAVEREIQKEDHSTWDADNCALVDTISAIFRYGLRHSMAQRLGLSADQPSLLPFLREFSIPETLTTVDLLTNPFYSTEREKENAWIIESLKTHDFAIYMDVFKWKERMVRRYYSRQLGGIFLEKETLERLQDAFAKLEDIQLDLSLDSYAEYIQSLLLVPVEEIAQESDSPQQEAQVSLDKEIELEDILEDTDVLLSNESVIETVEEKADAIVPQEGADEREDGESKDEREDESEIKVDEDESEKVVEITPALTFAEVVALKQSVEQAVKEASVTLPPIKSIRNERRAQETPPITIPVSPEPSLREEKPLYNQDIKSYSTPELLLGLGMSDDIEVEELKSIMAVKTAPIQIIKDIVESPKPAISIDTPSPQPKVTITSPFTSVTSFSDGLVSDFNHEASMSPDIISDEAPMIPSEHPEEHHSEERKETGFISVLKSTIDDLAHEFFKFSGVDLDDTRSESASPGPEM